MELALAAVNGMGSSGPEAIERCSRPEFAGEGHRTDCMRLKTKNLILAKARFQLPKALQSQGQCQVRRLSDSVPGCGPLCAETDGLVQVSLNRIGLPGGSVSLEGLPLSDG